MSFNNKFCVQLFCLSIWLCFVCGKEENCDLIDSYENYLGTKTPYRIVANTNSTEIKYKGCRAQKFWALVRHGSRHPNVQLIERMKERLPEIQNLILEKIKGPNKYVHNSDIDAFRKWTPKLEERDEKKLSHEGEDEMILLAERMQSRFPSVFDRAYTNTSYKFKFTATQRTRKSAQFFVAGLFGRQTIRDVDFPEPLKRDPILRFYKLCSKWRREVSKNAASLLERRRFETGKLMTKTIQDVNIRLGLREELDLTDIYTMYMACAFETASNKRRKSPWCSPFSLEDFKVLEYAEDLKYYWVDGYGHELTYKQACPAFNDMLDHFQDKDTHPKVTTYFTHSGTLLKMLAHMELYKDGKLRAEDFYVNGDRKWRVSKIDAFGTNLAFVLFDCDGKKKLLTMHQEEIVSLPSCPGADLCDLNKILRYYNDSVEECSFDEMCDNSDE